MRVLEKEDVQQVSGGNYNVVYVAATVNDLYSMPPVMMMLGQMMNGQMDPNMFIQSIENSGAQLVEFLYISSNNNMPPPAAGPCPPYC